MELQVKGIDASVHWFALACNFHLSNDFSSVRLPPFRKLRQLPLFDFPTLRDFSRQTRVISMLDKYQAAAGKYHAFASLATEEIY
jgi:hypothetical protein